MVIFNQALDPLYSRSGMLSSEAHLKGLTNWKAGKRRDKAKSELPVLKTGSPNVILLSTYYPGDRPYGTICTDVRIVNLNPTSFLSYWPVQYKNFKSCFECNLISQLIDNFPGHSG